MAKLPPALRALLEGTLIVVCDAPGAEVVVDGVDPRVALLVDTPADKTGKPRASRLFVYQRNLERMLEGPDDLERALGELIETELRASFPAVAGAEPQESTPH
jgi:hypothetical protein